jgi:tRNA-2-methylthio-N6-dimethylallyladenosine synthase
MFKFFIRVFGCPMRGIEAQKVKHYFEANHGLESSREEADVIAVFSCSIIKATDDITLEYLRKINNDDQRIIIFGCSPELSKEKIREFFHGEMVSTKKLEEEIDKLFPDFTTPFENIVLPSVCHEDLEHRKFYLDQYKCYQETSELAKEREAQIIITGKGCMNACSYCSVRRSLGRLKSYDLSVIEKTYMSALKDGNRVFVFNGDDTGAFKQESGDGFDTLLLRLGELSQNTEKVVWAIDNLHPQWLIKYEKIILKTIESGLLVDLLIPLQAATNRLLDKMRRKHTIEDVIPILRRIKSTNPEVKLTTHFIIGFPTETRADIQALKDFISMNLFQHIVLLRYYESGRASSHKLHPKVPADVAKKHMAELEEFINNKGIFCQMTE